MSLLAVIGLRLAQGSGATYASFVLIKRDSEKAQKTLSVNQHF